MQWRPSLCFREENSALNDGARGHTWSFQLLCLSAPKKLAAFIRSSFQEQTMLALLFFFLTSQKCPLATQST